MADDFDQEDPFKKYGGSEIKQGEDPFAKYGGKAIVKKKEPSPLAKMFPGIANILELGGQAGVSEAPSTRKPISAIGTQVGALAPKDNLTGVQRLDRDLNNYFDNYKAVKVTKLPINAGGDFYEKKPIPKIDINDNAAIGELVSQISNADYLEGASKGQKQEFIAALNTRALFNTAKQGITPTINQLGKEINQAVVSNIIEADRGESKPSNAKDDEQKINHFKWGLSHIEKTDPARFNNVIATISQEKKVPESDFYALSTIGQEVENAVKKKSAVVEKEWEKAVTNFDYTTFGQKKAAAAGKIGERLKKEGYKNQNEFTEKQIREAAEKEGIKNKDIVDELVTDENILFYDAIPKSGWMDDVAAGMMQPIQGVKSTLQTMGESPAETYLRSQKLDEGIGGQKVPDAKGQYSDILPSEREDWKTGAFRGAGQMLTNIAFARGFGGIGNKALGSTLNATQKANMINYFGTGFSTYLQTYGQEYEDALRRTGDAKKAKLLAAIDSGFTAGWEMLLPDVKIARESFDGVKRALGDQLESVIAKGGSAQQMAREAKPFIERAVKNISSIWGKEIAEEVGTNFTDYMTELVFSPKTGKERNLGKELTETLKEAAKATSIPAVVGGGASSLQTVVDEETQRDKLIQTAKDAAKDLGEMYRVGFEENPEAALKEVAQQLNASEGEAKAARRIYGDKISDAALELFPDEKVETSAAMQELLNQPKGHMAFEEEVQVPEEAQTPTPISESNVEGVEKYVSKMPKPEVPISEMNSTQLEEHSKNVRAYLKNQEVEFFGEEGAKKYRAARSISNSTMASREDVKEADRVMKEMEDSLSQEQRDDFFGMNQPEGIYDPSEIREVATRVRLVEESEDVNELGGALKLPLLDFSRNQNNEGTLAILNAAKKKAEELNLDPKEVFAAAIKRISNDIPDKNDQAMLAASIFEKLATPKEQPSNETATIQEGDESVKPVTPISQTTTTETVAEPPSPPTEGEAGEVGGDSNDLSGIKKALVSDEIIKGVDLERVPDKEMMALGRKILDTGEIKPEALVTKIITEGKGVLTPTEVVGLITYKRDIDNKLQDAYKEINKRKEEGEDLGTLGVEAADLERQQHDFDVMAVITAQQQSMAFRLRQRMLDRDYNVVTQIEKYKKNNNGYIPEEVEAKFKELGKQLGEVKAKLAEAEKKAAEKDGQESVDNIKESVDREKVFTDEQIEQKVKDGVQKEIDAIYDKLPKEKRTLADKAIKALENVQKKLRGGTYSDASGIVAIIDAGITTIKNAIKAGVAIADAVDIGIKKIKELMVKKGIKDFNEDQFRKDAIEGFEAEGVSTKKVKDKPTINEDGTVSIPNQMIRDLVSKGITDINGLADAVHKEVVKDLPDITKRQVRDYITDYGRTVNPTADDIQQQVNTAKRVGRLLSELEDLQNKKTKVKNPETRNKITEKEREIKRKIRVLQKELGISNQRILSEDEKLAAAKQRVKDRIAELERKIKNKDFAKKKKLPDAKDKELLALEAQKEKLQNQFEEEQYKVDLKNRNWWQKTEDVLLELTSGVVRGLVASFDLSATFVQGTMRLFVDIGKSAYQLVTLQKVKPNKSFIAFKEMFKHLVSQKYSDEYLTKVKASPHYPLMQASKLAIDDKSGHVSAKEGLFISNWINVIWNHAVAPALAMPVSIFTKGNVRKGYDIAKAINPYLASQRAFDGYVNSIRVNSFLNFAESLNRSGHNYEADPKVYQKAADVINTTTGRGSLGSADASSRWMNIFLFAPRKVVSEVKLFTPYAFLYYAKLPAPVRKKALIDLGVFLATFTTANTLVWAALKGDDDEDDNFWNPNSSDFLTHKIGNKRVSIGGGAKSMIVFQSRLLTGNFVDQYGNETQLGDRYGKTINTRLDLMWRFILGKASPAISAVSKKLDEKRGMELDDASVVKDLTIPIFLQDLQSLYKDSPVTVSAILTAFSIFGANVRTVEDSNKRSGFTEEDKKDPTFKYFLDKGMNLPNVVTASIDVPDAETKTIKNLTEFPEEKIEQYRAKHKEYLKEKLAEAKDNGFVYIDEYGSISTDYDAPPEGYDEIEISKLTKLQLAKILKAAQVAATNKTKEELFPK